MSFYVKFFVHIPAWNVCLIHEWQRGVIEKVFIELVEGGKMLWWIWGWLFFNNSFYCKIYIDWKKCWKVDGVENLITKAYFQLVYQLYKFLCQKKFASRMQTSASKMQTSASKMQTSQNSKISTCFPSLTSKNEQLRN